MAAHMTMPEHMKWRALVDDLRGWLNVMSTMRDQRPDFTDGELGWVRFERAGMLERVNVHRAAAGLPPVAESAVLCVERGACGHIDYVAKYAMGCADLVVGRADPVTGWPVTSSGEELNG
jgi:hypothetical protein